ncbi:hypothetical protein [Brevibacillus daliensis]|nr:hypothetical protein [Brevibacillus daliensis]
MGKKIVSFALVAMMLMTFGFRASAQDASDNSTLLLYCYSVPIINVINII